VGSFLQKHWRHVLPWVISAALLAYVFGWATDWEQLWAATRQANVPLFVAFATADRVAFFVVWTLLQAAALRRFVVHVPVRSVVAVRGGSELLRAISNPLSDAAFFLGLAQLAARRIDAVLAAAVVPGVCHFLVMLLQMTFALPFLEGGLEANRDVVLTACVIWLVVLVVGIAVWMSATRAVPLPGAVRLRAWLERFPFGQLRLFFWGFVALAVFDVLIQGLASRAFGVVIDWGALTARIPLLYLALIVPTLGNFGTREVTWAALFAGSAPRDTLIAYAFATNAIFLVINMLLGVVFLPRALELLAALRRARREGEPVSAPLLHDPTDL
jgi:hypothetical protein